MHERSVAAADGLGYLKRIFCERLALYNLGARREPLIKFSPKLHKISVYSIPRRWRRSSRSRPVVGGLAFRKDDCKDGDKVAACSAFGAPSHKKKAADQKSATFRLHPDEADLPKSGAVGLGWIDTFSRVSSAVLSIAQSCGSCQVLYKSLLYIDVLSCVPDSFRAPPLGAAGVGDSSPLALGVRLCCTKPPTR